MQCAEEWQQISTNYANEFAYANANSGKCLDDGENAANVTPAQYTCGAYPANMRWIHATFDFWNGGESIAYHNALYTAYGTKDRVLCANWQNPDSLFINNPSSSWAPGASNFCDWE